MAKLDRKHQKIFCDVTPANKLGVFGSYAAGSASYSDDPDTIQSLTAYGAGLSSALINNAPPAIQDIDGLCNLFTRQLSYLMQTGIPEWNASATYYIGSIVNNGTNALFVSVADDNINNALSIEAKWMLFKSAKVRYSTEIQEFTAYDDFVIDMNGVNSTFAITVYLPAAATTNIGRVITIKSLNQYGVYIYTLGGGLMDGVDEKIITQYGSMTFISNGTNWEVII
jgi:hypothetical protein